MTAIAPCSHGLPSPASCVDCMDDGPVMAPARPEPVTIEATFTARFAGQCQGCDLPVVMGQTIHKLSSGAYVHQGCE